MDSVEMNKRARKINFDKYLLPEVYVGEVNLLRDRYACTLHLKRLL